MMDLQALGLTAIFLLASVAGAAETPTSRLSSAQVIDRTVALVEGRVITLSELDFEARVGLIEAGGIASAVGALDDETLGSALRLSIAERLENIEADKLQAFPVEESEVEAALRQFRARFSSELEFSRFLERHEADVQQLSSLLARQLRAQKVLDSKVRLRAHASDAEVRRYYEEHRGELGPSFEKVREQIQEKLFRDHYQELAKTEVRQLRRNADVRLIAPFARSFAAIEGRP
jgi:hypothetical protein